MNLETLKKANDLKFSIDFFENILERIGDYKPAGNDLRIIPNLGTSIDMRTMIGDELYFKIMQSIVTKLQHEKKEAESALAKL